MVNYDPADTLREGGCPTDVAPTLPEMMGMKKQEEMAGGSPLLLIGATCGRRRGVWRVQHSFFELLLTILIDEWPESIDCSMKAQTQINLVVDELFTNIASQAYAPGSGEATIQLYFNQQMSRIMKRLIALYCC